LNANLFHKASGEDGRNPFDHSSQMAVRGQGPAVAEDRNEQGEIMALDGCRYGKGSEVQEGKLPQRQRSQTKVEAVGESIEAKESKWRR